MINVTSNDISLVKQQFQRRYAKIQFLNREWRSIGAVTGRLISGNIQIDGDTSIQRNASITVETPEQGIDGRIYAAFNCYVKLWCGIEDNNSTVVTWYSMGVFIIAESGFTFDPITRTLSITLNDLLTDLNGERAGELSEYTTIIKNGERIDDTIKAVLTLSGFENYDICPIGVLRDTTTFFDSEASEEDFLVPYDLEFSVGATAYEIIEKCVGLYPYYEAGFDIEGTFFVRRAEWEQDNSFVIMDAQTLRGLVISENTNIDWLDVRNYIEVWGKDGLWHGEAYDDTPGSPFQIASTKIIRMTVKDNNEINTNNIYDRYKNTELAENLLKQQAECEETIARLEALDVLTPAQRTELNIAKANLLLVQQQQKNNIAVSGNELAQQWAKRILYEKARLNDKITLTTILMPFLNDTGFKISYRSKTDNIVRTYRVTSISHDLSGNTSTLTAVRFYNEQLSSLQDALSKPQVMAYSVDGMTVSVTYATVEHAQRYALLIDRKAVVTGTGTALSYTLPDEYEGTHYVEIQAYADNYRNSPYSEAITAEFIAGDMLSDDDGDYIITDDNYEIEV